MRLFSLKAHAHVHVVTVDVHVHEPSCLHLRGLRHSYDRQFYALAFTILVIFYKCLDVLIAKIIVKILKRIGIKYLFVSSLSAK